MMKRMKHYKILLVEDDSNLGPLLKDYLETQSFHVCLCSDGEEGFATFQENFDIDLCILDINIPSRNGFELASDIRQLNVNVPIIFLTSRGDKEDVLKGYEHGADDYVTKPFESEVLVSKIHAVLNRTYSNQMRKKQQESFEIGDFKFDTRLRTIAYKDEDPARMSPKEAQLLHLLAIHINDLTPRNEALREIWQSNSQYTSRSMDVYIAKLRKLLKRDDRIEIINIHGKGFELVIRE